MVTLRDRSSLSKPSLDANLSSQNDATTTSSAARKTGKKPAKVAPKMMYKKRVDQKNKRITQPKMLKCPETGDDVWIIQATLQDIREAEKKKKRPWVRNRKYLVTIASPAVRAEIYDKAAAALEALEQRILPEYGGRPWKVVVRITDSNKQSPYFKWNEHSLELATWPQILEKIPAPPRFPGFGSSKAASAAVVQDEDDDDEESMTEEDVEIEDMLQREPCPLSNLAFEERWRVPMPNISVKWISPLRQTFTTRKSAWDNAMQLCQNEVFLDKTLAGFGSNGQRLKPTKCSQRTALKAGKIRFERDGLWVVGQEEMWQEERMKELGDYSSALPAKVSSNGRSMTPLNLYIQSNRQAHRDKRLRELKEAAASGKVEDASNEDSKRKDVVSFTLRDAERELRVSWKQLSEDERQEWTKKCKDGTKAREVDEASPTSVLESAACLTGSNDSDDAKDKIDRGDAPSPNCVQQNANEQVDTPVEPKALFPGTDDSTSILAKRPYSGPKLQDAKVWCLNDEQIQLCHDAGLQHYEQIMRTVKAKDLARELQDGFDLLRERGSGRFDMELPAFDEPRFKFLTDLKKAPWMPVVRQLLGKDVVLIHKGMFLSLPGASKQGYHQDGVHLTTQYQKPCHAINVFIPLVDMTMEHGPTEFCLGSHILGQEDYDEAFLETPLVPAGTPVIFDYRLGHLGLGNSSSECRPIVYCTYARASDGKEFRDTVNFSRKRYHKIGDLVSVDAPSRDERAKKRGRLLGESWTEPKTD